MADIIFSFDTEDYINEYAAEGILRLATILKEEGLVGCFNVVGMMAEALVEWGRQDIIDALQYHEIDNHSHRHSLHPTIDEYTDRADFEGALADFIKDERIGEEKLKRIFGVTDMPAACPPGSSTSYVAHYGYAKMGYSLYCGDDLFDKRQSRPIYACNIATTWYTSGLDKRLFTATEEELREYLETRVAPSHTFVMWHHPQRAYCTTYTDIDNLYGVNTPKEQWVISPAHTDEEIETFYKNFRLLLRLIKADPRFNVITYRQLAEKLKEAPRVINRDNLPALRAQLEEYFFPVTTPNSFCIADVFHACRKLLCGEQEHVCGEVYGFLDEPFAVTEPTTLQKKHLIAAARSLSGEGFLPEFIYVDDKKIGPADFLRAAMAVLVDGVEEYTVNPAPAQIDLDQFPNLRDLRYNNGWIHCKSMEDKYLSNRFRWQSWTFRLPAGTDRKIL